jgi:HAD superfamily hydrolase (TIGR01509 family)
LFKGVVFDFDGVVVDSHPAHLRAWRKFLGSVGKTVTEEQLQIVLDGRTRNDILRHFLGELCEDDLAGYGQRKDQIFRDEVANLQTIEGLLSFLQDLKIARLILGVASSGSRSRVEFLLRQLDLTKYFQTVVTGDEVAKGKPDPALFLRAAQESGVDAFDLIAFEDAVSGVKAARSAGMKCIGVGRLDRVSLLLNAGANHVVPDFRSLSYSKLRELFSNGASRPPIASVSHDIS